MKRQDRQFPPDFIRLVVEQTLVNYTLFDDCTKFPLYYDKSQAAQATLDAISHEIESLPSIRSIYTWLHRDEVAHLVREAEKIRADLLNITIINMTKELAEGNLSMADVKAKEVALNYLTRMQGTAHPSKYRENYIEKQEDTKAPPSISEYKNKADELIKNSLKLIE